MPKSGSSVRGVRKGASAPSTKAKGSKRVREPSAASLREIPPVDSTNAVYLGRGAEGLAKALAWSRSKRGRPKKGERAEGTVTRSVRLPKAAWKALEAIAKKSDTTVHALIREAIADELRRAA